ncbi:uncharacterized protein CC84DRAFT_871908 [Paraphaeosphaeria sporulosa]|uniref:Uncharacterized protein n=1 Tax=Paraphaeosphaeria sporulosa TaxID=1460663 RepID=A0A177CAT5_9PLEO|nr:uncharacterized protein CC84DRAFT_871908 [Paraphaeosphaeria sporulosa]OAG03877.1 hypothetical protein CC84DRAFT_871908 [Paraphaeosphaeria sporulosa]
MLARHSPFSFTIILALKSREEAGRTLVLYATSVPWSPVIADRILHARHSNCIGHQENLRISYTYLRRLHRGVLCAVASNWLFQALLERLICHRRHPHVRIILSKAFSRIHVFLRKKNPQTRYCLFGGTDYASLRGNDTWVRGPIDHDIDPSLGVLLGTGPCISASFKTTSI